MKKMLAIIGAVAFAAVANAGTVTWGCSGLQSPDAVGNMSGNALSGGISYLIEGTVDASAINTSILAGTFMADYGNSALANKATSSTGAISQTKIGSYVSEDVSLYMIVFDAATVADSNWYLLSDTITKTFGATGNQTFQFKDNMDSKWTAATAVPEPTSGLLLLLGMAGLALKRKQA